MKEFWPRQLPPKNSDRNTKIIEGDVKIAPCHACGHVRQISKETGLCGVASCRRRREGIEE